ncbi:LVIVD repeat-containing protein [Natribaculum luteum]|uniref:LVIVD repeat-containing protein n=1 Tax=Natribaculum luteum TaxID=1586232 RepID=A0ABD5P3P0_9EURY|nr:hypothetical protein [Natribaculum luteum]
MRRRTLLRAGVGTAAATTLGSSVPATAAADAYEPLGRLEVDGACETVVGDDGDVAYLAVVDGFAVVDVSDPRDPTLLAERRDIAVGDRRLTDVLDVDVAGDRLAVPGPANPAFDDDFYGIVCYDVSDPSDPVRAGEPYETGFHVHNCSLDDETLYLVCNGTAENPLVVLDASGDDFEEIARWSVADHEPAWRDVDSRLHYLHDVTVHGDVAALAYWNAGTYLLDVSDPSDPQYLGHVAETTVDDQLELDAAAVNDAYLGLPGNDHFATLDERGDLLAVGRESWATDPGDPEGAGGIDLFDVSDRDDIRQLATIDPPATADASYRGGSWTTAHNFELRGGHLYSAWYQGGVKIHDVTDPAEPEELAWWRDPETAGFWTARVAREDVFVASSTTLIPNAPTDGGLYTFPIEAGQQADPPSLTGDDERTATDPEPESTNDSGSESGGDQLSGFTATAGLAGGALALEWLRRRGSEE